MNRFKAAFTYRFHQNLGWQDRLIRAVGCLAVLGAWFLGYLTGPLAIGLGIFALMILPTSVLGKCNLNYLARINTVGKAERARLDRTGKPYDRA